MKKILSSILLIFTLLSLIGCDVKDSLDIAGKDENPELLISAEKTGSDGSFDIYKLTYADGFETEVKIGDNSVVESVTVVNGALAYKLVGTFVFSGKLESDGNGGYIIGGSNAEIIDPSSPTISLTPGGSSTSGGVISFATPYITSPVPHCDHTFGDFVKKDDSTCSKHGTDEAACTKCGFVLFYYHEKPAHTYDRDTVIVVEATCTKDGYTANPCTKCSAHDKIESTKAKGHTYGSDGLCTTCGEKQ